MTTSSDRRTMAGVSSGHAGLLHALVIAGGRASRLGGIDKTALEYRGILLRERATGAAISAVSAWGVDGGMTVVVGLPSSTALSASTALSSPTSPTAPASPILLSSGHPRLLEVTEQPAHGGPAAAIVAGLEVLPRSTGWVVVLASDLPHVTEAVPFLASALQHQSGRNAGLDGVIALDSSGRRQYLLAVYRLEALRQAAAALPSWAGMPVRTLVANLDLVDVPLPDPLCADIDTVLDAENAGITLPH